MGSLSQLSELKQLLQGNDPKEVAMRLAQRNPAFAQFVQENKDKTVEQIASDYGVDINLIKNFLK